MIEPSAMKRPLWTPRAPGAGGAELGGGHEPDREAAHHGGGVVPHAYSSPARAAAPNRIATHSSRPFIARASSGAASWHDADYRLTWAHTPYSERSLEPAPERLIHKRNLQPQRVSANVRERYTVAWCVASEHVDFCRAAWHGDGLGGRREMEGQPFWPGTCRRENRHEIAGG